MRMLVFGHHEDRTPTHGYEPTRRRDGGIRQELAAGVTAMRMRGSRPLAGTEARPSPGSGGPLSVSTPALADSKGPGEVALSHFSTTL